MAAPRLSFAPSLNWKTSAERLLRKSKNRMHVSAHRFRRSRRILRTGCRFLHFVVLVDGDFRPAKAEDKKHSRIRRNISCDFYRCTNRPSPKALHRPRRKWRKWESSSRKDLRKDGFWRPKAACPARWVRESARLMEKSR